jgi:hypothetical protein
MVTSQACRSGRGPTRLNRQQSAVSGLCELQNARQSAASGSVGCRAVPTPNICHRIKLKLKAAAWISARWAMLFLPR